jgi:AAA domain
MTGKLQFTSAADITPEAPRWVWADRLPLGTFCLSAGKGGSAKSLHAVWLAARVTEGTLPGCWHGKPRRVLWATLEASPSKEVIPRLMAAGADLEMVEFVRVESDEDPVEDHIRIFDPDLIEQMRDKVEDDGVGLIVLDPALDVIGYVNNHDQQEVRYAIGHLAAFAEEMNMLILGLAHFNKMTSVDDALDRITGSAAWSQRVRAAMVLGYDDVADQYVVSQPKNNWGKTSVNGGLPNLAFTIEEVQVQRHPVITAIRVRWNEEGSEHSVDDLLARKHQKEESPSRVEDAVQALRYELRQPNERCRTEVIDACLAGGHTRWAIKEAAKQLGLQSTKCLHRKGSSDNAAKDWRLP